MNARQSAAEGQGNGPEMADLQALLSEAVTLADAALDHWLPKADEPPVRLHQAMRHSIFAGGKRLRPALVLASARAVSPSLAARSAQLAAGLVAVEALHTYTLIHDDLPAMDDDDLRRGRPTCHKAFDEATAILAGDALQALSFLAAATLGAEAVTVLGNAGVAVVQGQQDDLDAEGKPVDGAVHTCKRLERIHRRKTAALIRASCELGAIAGGADAPTRATIAAFGETIGLAFQVADDVLDVTASSAQLGKTAGKDAEQGKLTYVAVHGLENARNYANLLEAEALAMLEPLGAAAAPLAALGRFAVRRTS